MKKLTMAEFAKIVEALQKVLDSHGLAEDISLPEVCTLDFRTAGTCYSATMVFGRKKE